MREVLAIAPDPIVRIVLAVALLKSGRPAEPVRKLEPGRTSFENRAISALHEGIKTGSGNLKKIRTDPAFTLLRSRPEFHDPTDLAFSDKAIAR